MRRLMRVMGRREDGAVATVVAILLAGGVLLGMAALTVDVGRLYSERRELQNGADAAALAVAQDCAKGLPCDAGTGSGSLAGTYANTNAKDSASNVNRVCGKGAATLPGCPAPSSNIYDCPPTPAGGTRYVEVETSTRTAGGSTLLPPAFARALLGNGGYSGTTVSACARAAWGAAKSIQGLPVTISACEWNNYTANGTSFAPPPPYSTYPTSYEHALYLHDTSGATSCPAGPSGSDLPGGFGWLDSSNCSANIDENSWVYDDPGVSVNQDCKSVMNTLVGTTVYVPVFDAVNNLTGSNGQYHVKGFAAFFLTGYNLPAASGNPQKSIATGTKLCTGSDKCLYGWFTEGLVPVGTAGGTGPAMGATVVSLIG